jgi:hypothetical protein
MISDLTELKSTLRLHTWILSVNTALTSILALLVLGHCP